MLIPVRGDNHADAVGKAVRALDTTEPLTLIRRIGDDDLYHRGPTPGGSMFLIMGLWTGMPAELLTAVRMRRTTGVTGRCPNCDTCLDVTTGTYTHEHWCVVGNDRLGPMLTRWLRRVGVARGRRIEEDPTGSTTP